MISRGTMVAAALTLAASLPLSGCGSSNHPATQPSASSTSSLAADVPRGYDPCNDVPQSVLDSEKLQGRDNSDSNAGGGVKWRGCMWARANGNGYTVAIRTTNLTVDAVRAKNFPEAQELTVDGRRAISTRQFDGPDIKEACTLNVEMKGGTLEFNVDNPPSNPDTGSMDACQIARTLADKVVPTVPATS
ncbi:DUF3558 domain-containing protein [Nocardia terpenica]|uniref:DUF3558 domain-containing protein n=1 Tax=Nocardia terpenica TaxID=455432 RepID=UPI002FE126C8